MRRIIATTPAPKPTPSAKSEDLSVFITSSESICFGCKEALGRKAWIMLLKQEAYCLACAELDHLVFLPAGDAALTRRSKKHSTISAVVLRWNARRNRYERQGLLVEEAAIAKAETECLSDQDLRKQRQQREEVRRGELDAAYVQRFAEVIRQRYPHCPAGRDMRIAEHACRKYSGRVGRTANAKSFESDAIELAVKAHIRHTETDYDSLFSRGLTRSEARHAVGPKVAAVLAVWRGE